MLIEPQFRTKIGDEIWGMTARISRMASFEGALALAQARVGLIPEASAHLIVETCKTGVPDTEAIYEEAKISGNPAIPFVRYLRNSVASKNPAAATHVHFGATSQDVIDTANMMALAEIANALDSMLLQVSSDLRTMAMTHAKTPMVGRTLLQQATPITFGLKAALWSTSIAQTREKLKNVQRADMAVQLGGSNGTLSVMAPHGATVRADIAEQLKLTDPDKCWHILRGRILTVASSFAAVAGAAAKIAGDCILMMQTEIGELHEGAPGGSSSMPHKRNPVDALVPVAVLPLTAAHLSTITVAQMQSHERGVGSWHSEWIALPTFSALTLASVERLKAMVTHLKVDAARMRENLSRAGGSLATEELCTNLFEEMGYHEAHDFIRSLLNQGDHATFADRVLSNSKISRMIPKRKLDEILRYKQPLEVATTETQNLINKIKIE